MIELLDNKDPFESVVGWNLEKKKKLVADAIVLLSQMNKAEFRMARCSINESARVRLAGQGHPVPGDPLRECAKNCLFVTVGAYMMNTHPGDREPLYLFYDRGEKFFGRFKQNWLASRSRHGRRKDPDNWWDQFADIQDLDLPYHAPLQAADMIAWAHSRTLSDKERPFSHVKTWLEKVIPASTLDITRK